MTAHGFRSTFRTWAEEVTGLPHAVIEEAMGHQVGNQVERAYRRSDVLEKRRELMVEWASYCEPDRIGPGEARVGGDGAHCQKRTIVASASARAARAPVASAPVGGLENRTIADTYRR